MNYIQTVGANREALSAGSWKTEAVAYYVQLIRLKNSARDWCGRDGVVTVMDSKIDWDLVEIQVTSCLELLYSYIPEDHDLKQLDLALHLQTPLKEDPDSAKLSTNSNLKITFDGYEKRLWFPFRGQFESEVMNNVYLSNDAKFELLLARLVKNSPPMKVALNYCGLPQSCVLAWDALQREYGNVVDHVREQHVAIKGMPRRCSVASENDHHRLKLLCAEARLRIAASRGLGLNDEVTGDKIFNAIMECLPWNLRKRIYESSKPHDNNICVWVNNILTQLDHEIEKIRDCQLYNSPPSSSFQSQRNQSTPRRGFTRGRGRGQYKKYGRRVANYAQENSEEDAAKIKESHHLN